MSSSGKLLISIIVPVYNRLSEVEELLNSLTKQTTKEFEVIIVEDGSDVPCKEIVDSYSDRLIIHYHVKKNSGPGPSRNYGAERANGNYFVFFDSDCLIPPSYFDIVITFLNSNYLDAYGGPDMAHSSFSVIQKAINYSMTSFFTTGGIRGGKEKLDKFHPRSFNMGFSKEVFAKTGGFSTMRFGEDVDMSLRIIEKGFSTGLISEAGVYHKRRTDFRKFFKQVYNSGIARIHLYMRHPSSLKPVHFLPMAFVLGNLGLIILSVFRLFFLLPIALFVFLIFTDSLLKNKSLAVAFCSVISAYIQMFAYGTGFINALWKRLILQKDEFSAFKRNFYK